MKSVYRFIVLLIIVGLAVQSASAQVTDEARDFGFWSREVTNAPLYLATNGPGFVLPLHSGQMLEVGRKYAMVALPDRGYVFTNWNAVNVFTVTAYEIDYATVPPTTIPITFTDYSPLPPSSNDPLLIFTMQPEISETESSTNGDVVDEETITESHGWQANFVPAPEPRRYRSW